jgi:hypothetical protein
MIDEHPKHLAPLSKFLVRLVKNLLIALGMVAVSLFIGMVGYRHFEKMSWIDAYVNASMILSGMGPVSTLNTDAGKIFAGSYALFSGIFFLIVMAIVIAPLFRRFLHKFHLEEMQK